MRIFATDNFIGALAHLARAFDWQSRGDQFESGMLHPREAIQHQAESLLLLFIPPRQHHHPQFRCLV